MGRNLTATPRKQSNFNRAFPKLLALVHQAEMVKKNYPIYSALHRAPEGIKLMYFELGNAEKPGLNGYSWMNNPINEQPDLSHKKKLAPHRKGEGFRRGEYATRSLFRPTT